MDRPAGHPTLRTRIRCVAVGAFTGLIWLTPSLVVPAEAQAPLPNASTTVDGVKLDVYSSFLPGSFEAALAGAASQVAVATSWTPYQQLEIIAIPFGTFPPIDGLPTAKSGGASSELSVLATDRTAQGGYPAQGPTGSFFGVVATSITSDVPLRGMASAGTTQVRIVEWVTEAGPRLWLIRASAEITSASAATAFTLSVSGLVVTSSDVTVRTTVGAGLSVLTTHAYPSPMQDLARPSWWNAGTSPCDQSLLSTSAPLGETFRNMYACGPLYLGTQYPTTGFPGTAQEYEWQCVELSMRYMYLAYGQGSFPLSGGSAFNIVDNYPGSFLQKVHNNVPSERSRHAPQPGDIIAEYTSDPNGHTAVVTRSAVDGNGTGNIWVIEQNFNTTGARQIGIINWVVQSSVTAWLQNPLSPYHAAMTGNGPNDIDLFERGTDGNLWHDFMYGGSTWAGWERPANSGNIEMFSSPVSLKYAGQIVVFMRDIDSKLRESWWAQGTGWNNADLGGVLNGNPAAIVYASNYVYIFGRRTDGLIQYKYWNGVLGTWIDWQLLPWSYAPTSDLAVIEISGNIHVLYSIGNGQPLYETVGHDGAWSGPYTVGLGGQAGGNPAAVSVDANDAWVFVKGTDNAAWDNFRSQYTNWGSWEARGGVIGSDFAMATSNAQVDVYTHGSPGDPNFYESWRDYYGTWNAWARMPAGSFTNAPAAMAPDSTRLFVFGKGTDNMPYYCYADVGTLTHTWHTWQQLGGIVT